MQMNKTKEHFIVQKQCMYVVLQKFCRSLFLFLSIDDCCIKLQNFTAHKSDEQGKSVFCLQIKRTKPKNPVYSSKYTHLSSSILEYMHCARLSVLTRHVSAQKTPKRHCQIWNVFNEHIVLKSMQVFIYCELITVNYLRTYISKIISRRSEQITAFILSAL